MTLTEQQVRVVNLIEVRGKRPRALDAPPPRHRPFNLRPCVVGRRGLARERDRTLRLTINDYGLEGDEHIAGPVDRPNCLVMEGNGDHHRFTCHL